MRQIALTILLLTTSLAWGQAAAQRQLRLQKPRKTVSGSPRRSPLKNRDSRQKPKELVAAMGLKPGMTVGRSRHGA